MNIISIIIFVKIELKIKKVKNLTVMLLIK